MQTAIEAKREHDQFELLIKGLINDQYGCCDDFLKQEEIDGLRDNIERMNTLDKLKSAGLGNAVDYHKNVKIRGDKIQWIETKSNNEFEKIFLKKIHNFITHLNRTCYTSIIEFESHYARYETKRFYKRHIDQFKTDNGRKYSMIIYLNENWNDEDGGHLTLFPIGCEEIHISPIAGRMVFFKSDEMEHEVNPSFTRNRISIAGWFKN